MTQVWFNSNLIPHLSLEGQFESLKMMTRCHYWFENPYKNVLTIWIFFHFSVCSVGVVVLSFLVIIQKRDFRSNFHLIQQQAWVLQLIFLPCTKINPISCFKDWFLFQVFNLQGVWTQKVIFQSVLTDRNMQVELDLKMSLKGEIWKCMKI